MTIALGLVLYSGGILSGVVFYHVALKRHGYSLWWKLKNAKL